ncbi:hypothetical protein DMA11_17615 [Marinilabiliaceae bacterium JC017]|nr:hypothetical protein DMA11_17615 [Marinilabiliaceae bacterium JC017]
MNGKRKSEKVKMANNKSFYVYPTYTPERDKSGNTYIRDFADAFSGQYRVHNEKGKLGIISVFFNLKADYFIFHWVDLIITKQKGHLQVLFFFIEIKLLRLLKKKVIWVLHNKKPHRINSKLAMYCMKVAAHHSDIIICHAKEGREFVEQKYGLKCGEKVRYIPHPVYSDKIVDSLPKKWDIVIWGTIARYKNIVPFLRFVKQSGKFKQFKILVCGYCPDKEYEKEILEELSLNICYVDRFLTDDELQNELRATTSILFTYKLDSVLSSGALVYSLNFNKKIIGPSGGAFQDLMPMVTCYDTFEDLEQVDFNEKVSVDYYQEYLSQNTWDKVPLKIINLSIS